MVQWSGKRLDLDVTPLAETVEEGKDGGPVAQDVCTGLPQTGEQ